ncbi:MAG: DNA-binding NarL/FixJ family response regulator [Planctomycetaceae bacterium]|jgi:DNA-binding NarL/FixJ family response regulator
MGEYSDTTLLTALQRDIVRLVASGGSVREIALQLEPTPKAIARQLSRLMQQIGVSNRIELTRFAIESGHVDVLPFSETPEPSELSDRQREVVALTSEGLSISEIAELLKISTRTADAHKHKAMHRLDIHDPARLLHYSVRHDLPTPLPESVTGDPR